MSVTREGVLELLNSVMIQMPAVLNQIIADYWADEAMSILAQEEDLYALLMQENRAMCISSWSDDEDLFRKHFQATLRVISNGFSIVLPTSNTIMTGMTALAHLTTIGLKRQEGHYNLTPYINVYRHYLKSHHPQISEFATSTLELADTHVAISCTQDEFSFLLKLIQAMDVAWPFGDTVSKINESILDRYLLRKALLRDYSTSLLILENTTGHVIYLDKDLTRAIAGLRNLVSQKSEWEQFKHRHDTSPLKQHLLEHASLASSVIDIIVAYATLPSIDTLLQLDEQLVQCAGDQWVVENTFPPITPTHPRILRAIKDKTPIAFYISELKLEYFNDPTIALARFITGKQFQRFRSKMAPQAYPLAAELIAGMLLYTNTHVCININDLFYNNIEQQLKIKLDKLDKDSTFEQQDDFQTQLNQFLPSAAYFMMIIEKAVNLYVPVEATKAIAMLTSLTESTQAVSFYRTVQITRHTLTMFNMPPKLQAPEQQLPYLELRRQHMIEGTLSNMTGIGTVRVDNLRFFNDNGITVKVPGPVLHALEQYHKTGSGPHLYRDAVREVITKLQGYDHVPQNSLKVLYPYATKKQQFLQQLIKKFETQTTSIVDPKSARDYLVTLQAEIEVFMKTNAKILKPGLRGRADAKDKLEATKKAAAEKISEFEKTMKHVEAGVVSMTI